MHNPRPISRIAIIGFGEVGGIFGNDFAEQGIEVSVFDILLASERHRQHMLSKARSCGVKAEENLLVCLRNADLVISAVTSSSALDVAQEAGPILRRSRFLTGEHDTQLDIRDVTWLGADGGEMTEAEWNTGWIKCFGRAPRHRLPRRFIERRGWGWSTGHH